MYPYQSQMYQYGRNMQQQHQQQQHQQQHHQQQQHQQHSMYNYSSAYYDPAVRQQLQMSRMSRGVSSYTPNYGVAQQAPAASTQPPVTNFMQPPTYQGLQPPRVVRRPSPIPDLGDKDIAETRRVFSAPEWSTSFLDYKRLKVQVEKVIKIASKYHGQSSQGNLYSQAHHKACELFWCIIRSEVDKVNKVYLEKENQCLQKFQVFQFDTFTHCEKLHESEVLCLFASVFKETCPDQFDNFSSKALPCCANFRRPSNIDDLTIMANFKEFFGLLSDLDKLRKYTILNYTATIRAIQLYDQGSGKEKTLPVYMSELLHEPFYSGMTLSQLIVRTECVAASLMAQHSDAPPPKKHYMCGLCNQILLKPVVLSCDHRFCWGCVEQSAFVQKQESGKSELRTANLECCPTCKKHQDINPANLKMDSVLDHFLQSHFAVEIEARQRKVPFPFARNAFSADVIKTERQPQQKRGLETNHSARFQAPKRHKTKNTMNTPVEAPEDVFSKSGSSFVTQNLAFMSTCFHCKQSKPSEELLFCTHNMVSNRADMGQPCQNKYCNDCLTRLLPAVQVMSLFQEQIANGSQFSWRCPHCTQKCSCRSCGAQPSHQMHQPSHQMQTDNNGSSSMSYFGLGDNNAMDTDSPPFNASHLPPPSSNSSSGPTPGPTARMETEIKKEIDNSKGSYSEEDHSKELDALSQRKSARIAARARSTGGGRILSSNSALAVALAAHVSSTVGYGSSARQLSVTSNGRLGEGVLAELGGRADLTLDKVVPPPPPPPAGFTKDARQI